MPCFCIFHKTYQIFTYKKRTTKLKISQRTATVLNPNVFTSRPVGPFSRHHFSLLILRYFRKPNSLWTLISFDNRSIIRVLIARNLQLDALSAYVTGRCEFFTHLKTGQVSATRDHYHRMVVCPEYRDHYFARYRCTVFTGVENERSRRWCNWNEHDHSYVPPTKAETLN